MDGLRSLDEYLGGDRYRTINYDELQKRDSTAFKDILFLLASNKGWVLTYNQIYEKVWNDISTGNERNTSRLLI